MYLILVLSVFLTLSSFCSLLLDGELSDAEAPAGDPTDLPRLG